MLVVQELASIYYLQLNESAHAVPIIVVIISTVVVLLVVTLFLAPLSIADIRFLSPDSLTIPYSCIKKCFALILLQ